MWRRSLLLWDLCPCLWFFPLFLSMKNSVTIYLVLSLSLLLKSLFNPVQHIELNQYIGLLYALTYWWSWTGSIQVLLLSFHHEVKQIPVGCFFGAIQFTSMEQAQSFIFLDEVEANRNWQFLSHSFCAELSDMARIPLSEEHAACWLSTSISPSDTNRSNQCLYVWIRR